MSEERIDGKYQILKSLGAGMSGEVFLVEDPKGETMALKRLKGWQLGRDQELALESFKDEFRVLKNLHHPSIARILDFGRESETGCYYFTSEFVDGTDFFSATEQKTPEECEELFVQALRALEYLHAQGILHLDIKASNLLVTPNGTVKLIDFGLASERLRQKMVGTPTYMPPEIIYRETPDNRADLYSLGILFYYTLARDNPFKGKGIQDTLERQKHLTPPLLIKGNPQIPKYFDAILERLLKKNRLQRYQQAARVIRDINLLGGKDYPIETSDTLLSYLPEEGALVGRQQELGQVQRICQKLQKSPPASFRTTVWIRGRRGAGKSRLLQELKYFCQLNDIAVLSFDPSLPPVPEKEPTVLLLDDVDRWLDEERDRWFDFLQRVEGIPLIFLITTPPDVPYPLPVTQAMMTTTDLETVTLNNLSKEELTEYLISLTGLEEPPPQLIDALYVRTDGNPLFVSEILRTLIANQLLFDSHGRWQRSTLDDIGVDFSRLSLPETLKELLSKAYQELSSSLQELLTALTLLRHPPTLVGLHHLLPHSSFESDLREANRQGLILKDPINQTVALRNTLWKEVVLEAVAIETQQRWHDRIANWLQEQEQTEELAYHRGHGSDPAQAFPSLFPLAQGLVRRGRGLEAIPLLEKVALHAQELTPREQIDLKIVLGEATLQAGHYTESLASFEATRPLLANIENRDEDIFYKVDIHEKLSGVCLKLGHFDEAKADAQAGLTLLTDYRDDPIRRMILENALAQVWCHEGALDRAKTQFTKTEQAWRELPASDQDRVTNNDLGFVYLLQGETEKAISKLAEQLNFTQRLPKRYPEARCRYNLAEASFANHDHKATIDYFQSCLQLARTLKSYDLLLRAYNGLGNVYTTMKEITEGIDYYSRALTMAQKLADRSSQAAIHCNLGILHQEREEDKEAEHHLIGSIQVLQAVKDKSAHDIHYLARSHLEMGSLFRRQKRFESARDHLRDAETLIQEHPALQGLQFWVSYEFAQLYQGQNRSEEFAECVRQLQKLAKTPEELQKLEGLVPSEPGQPKASSSPPDTTQQEAIAPAGTGATTAWKGLLKILRFLNSETDPEFLLKSILRYALELSSAETGLILLKNKAGQLEIRAALQTTRDPELETFSTQIAEQVLQEGKPVMTDNAQTDDRFAKAESVHLLKLRSILALPISTPQQIIGVLYLDTRIQDQVISNSETLELLQAFADQAGLALEHAQRLTASQSSQQNLEQALQQTQDELSLARSVLLDESLHLQTRYSYKNIITRSRAMQELFRVLDKITDTTLSVLILGATGTGKELIARALHHNSSRGQKEFVAINCGAIPAELIESELFGHKAGSFTGATRDKIGLCELADGGTLFLDEVGELPPPLQVKMLRFLQEKEFRRVGETITRRVDVRVVAATHQDLEAKVQRHEFREDFYFRLCEIPLQIPALSERREDIPLLASRFMKDYQTENSLKKKFKIERRLLQKMIDYDWPGNVRELENFIRVACALAENQVLSLEALPQHSPLAPASPTVSKKTILATQAVLIDGTNHYRSDWKWHDYERILMAHAYQHHHFRALPAAQSIGISPPTMYRKIKEWELEDSENPLYAKPFVYQPEIPLKDFRNQLFSAALKHHQKPYATLRALGVSQGFFYKVLREVR